MTNLGKRGRDKVTGFEGVIVGQCTYLFGCSQYGIAPPVHEGKVPETLWFDTGRIEITGEGVSAADVAAEKPGGLDMKAPNRVIR